MIKYFWKIFWGMGESQAWSYRRMEEVEPDETSIEIDDLPFGILCNFRVMAENAVGQSDALAMKKFLRIRSYLGES